MKKEPYIEVDPEQAQQLIEDGKVKIIDVRQPYEYQNGHIEQAVLVPINGLYEFALGLSQQDIAKDQPVLLVCEMGQRSAAASEVASIAGYDTVYNLEGGMNGWRYAGMPVVRAPR